MADNEPILKIRGLSKTFGALMAIHRIDLDVSKGEVLGIIGPNGAGKTTFFNLLTGVLKPTSGEIRFKGEKISKLPPHKICHRGIVRTFQITQVFPQLTVLENVRLAAQFKNKRACLRFFGGKEIERVTETLARESLNLLGLSNVAHLTIEKLSHADQRLVEICMSLAQDPEVLLLDEPTAGLSIQETTVTMKVLKEISRERQHTILLVEHDMDVVFYLADRIIVLGFGEIIAEGSEQEIRSNERVQKAYLGGSE